MKRRELLKVLAGGAVAAAVVPEVKGAVLGPAVVKAAPETLTVSPNTKAMKELNDHLDSLIWHLENQAFIGLPDDFVLPKSRINWSSEYFNYSAASAVDR